jgi:hypothetical protein
METPMRKFARWARLIREIGLAILMILQIINVMFEIANKAVNCNAGKLHS